MCLPRSGWVSSWLNGSCDHSRCRLLPNPQATLTPWWLFPPSCSVTCYKGNCQWVPVVLSPCSPGFPQIRLLLARSASSEQIWLDEVIMCQGRAKLSTDSHSGESKPASHCLILLHYGLSSSSPCMTASRRVPPRRPSSVTSADRCPSKCVVGLQNPSCYMQREDYNPLHK